MASFEQSYRSGHSPEKLWRAINTPLLDPNLIRLVHEDLEVGYDDCDPDGQIGPGTTITYRVSETGTQKVPMMYRPFIPSDGTFFVARMPDGYKDGEETQRHDVLMSDMAEGSITRTVEAEGEGSVLVVQASFTAGIVGEKFDDKIVRAIRHCVGIPSQNTIDLLPDILASR